MASEYIISLTPRQRDSLLDEGLQRWLVGVEGNGHPYWTHTIAQVIEQILNQNNNEEPINEYVGEEFKFTKEKTKAHDTCSSRHPLPGKQEDGHRDDQ
jgi:hypothetical protein